MTKFIIIGSIFSLVIAGAVFVVQNSSFGQLAVLPNQNPESINNEVSDRPFIEALVHSIKSNGAVNNNSAANQPLVESLSSGQEANFSNNSPKKNLTELFIQNIGNSIEENNPAGPGNVNGENYLNAPEPDIIAEELILKAASQFNPQSLRPIINDNDLIISSNESREALINYLSSFNQIILNSAGSITQEQINASLNATEESIGEIIRVFKKTIDSLYRLPVPQKALEIHKNELSLLSAQMAIFEKMANYQSDPLLAILAADNIDSFEKDLLALEKEIAQFIKDNNLDK